MGCVWGEIKAANESLLGKLQYLSGTNTGEDGQSEEKTKDYFILNDECVEGGGGWRIWKVVPVEVAPMLLIPQSIISKI